MNEQAYKQLVEAALDKALTELKAANEKYQHRTYPQSSFATGESIETNNIRARIADDGKCWLTVAGSSVVYQADKYKYLTDRLLSVSEYKASNAVALVRDLQKITAWLLKLCEKRDKLAAELRQQEHAAVVELYNYVHKKEERKRFFNITREKIDAGEAFVVVDDSLTAVVRLRNGALEVANVEVPAEFQQLPNGWYECSENLTNDKTVWQFTYQHMSVLNKAVLVEERGETYFARLARNAGSVAWQVLENDMANYIIHEHFDDFDYERHDGIYFIPPSVNEYIEKYERWTEECEDEEYDW